MGRTGQRHPAPAGRPDDAWAPPVSHVQTGAEGRRKAGITRDHQRQPAGAANSRERTAEGRTVGIGIVAQDHPGTALRKPCHGRARVGQPACVGEQP